jgi:type IV pilus assembly protein PilB
VADKSSQLRIQGGISQDQLRTAIIKCSEQKKSLIEYVLADEKVSEEGLADSIASYLRFPRVNLAATNIDPEAVKLMPQEVARKYLCIPIRFENRQMHLAMANPTDYRALQEVEFVLGRTVKVFVCTRTEILDAIERFHKTEDTLKEFTDNLEGAMDLKITPVDSTEAEVNISRSMSAAELPPVVKVVNLIIQDAITQRGTDIHVEPTLNDVQVRVRVDGVLRPLMQLPKWLTNPVSSRLKVLSRLDIAERRVPQDGRLKVNMHGQSYDFRVSTLPTLFGEKVVMRILSSDTQLPTLEKLDLDDHDRRILLGSLMQPQGLILVTGPTGSGKTSTLVACLAHRKSPGLNIITVEDPLEYQIQGINQVQVNVKTGLTFAAALRSILRQDPDVVLVGEMRDLETTEIAFHAALTGHLVLSTLHTNSAIATLTRLLDLGVDPTLVNSAVTLIIAQRLVRKLCKDCKRPSEPPAWMLERLGVDQKAPIVFYEAVGCSKCGGTGYVGRAAVLEFLPMTKSLREIIASRMPEVEIKSTLRKQGMKFLLDKGREVAEKGNTDLNELFRVLQLDAEEEDAGSHCPHCNAVIESGFTICPSCMSHLTFICQQCRQELKKEWNVCPYCQTPVGEERLQLPPAELSLPAAGVDAKTLPSGEAELSSPAPPEPAPDRGHSKKRRSPGGKLAEETSTVATEPPRAVQTAPPKKPVILIVDDDASIRTIVRKALEQLPFPIETHIAADGAEALQVAEKIHPDLLVLDVMMPGMDGFEVCSKLRSQVKTAFIPIMMLTANSNEQGRIKGYLVGADDYVSKPFSVPELNARVTRLLRRAYGLS